MRRGALLLITTFEIGWPGCVRTGPLPVGYPGQEALKGPRSRSGPRALRSYLVGVVVTLDTLTVERTQEGSRKDIPTDIDNGQGR